MDSVIRAQMKVSSDDLRRQLAYIADQLVSDAPGGEGSNSAKAGKPFPFSSRSGFFLAPHCYSTTTRLPPFCLPLSDDTEEDGYVSDDEEDIEEDEDDAAPEDPLSFDADEVCASAVAVPVLEAMRHHLIRYSLPSQGGNSAR